MTTPASASRPCSCLGPPPGRCARLWPLALRRYGVPDQILTDNGKVFTGRFGPGKGRGALRPHLPGERHPPPAHRSPLPHHHRQGGALPQDGASASSCAGRVFASLEEAQAELDAWVDRYNTERPHQGIGMVSPETRFALAPSEVVMPVFAEEGEGEEAPQAVPRRLPGHAPSERPWPHQPARLRLSRGLLPGG